MDNRYRGYELRQEKARGSDDRGRTGMTVMTNNDDIDDRQYDYDDSTLMVTARCIISLKT
jgi:hypothetical protein